jgi:hypothetical protein
MNKTPYGYCPFCGQANISMARNPVGPTECPVGHSFPHAQACKVPPAIPPVAAEPVEPWPWFHAQMADGFTGEVGDPLAVWVFYAQIAHTPRLDDIVEVRNPWFSGSTRIFRRVIGLSQVWRDGGLVVRVETCDSRYRTAKEADQQRMEFGNRLQGSSRLGVTVDRRQLLVDLKSGQVTASGFANSGPYSALLGVVPTNGADFDVWARAVPLFREHLGVKQ